MWTTLRLPLAAISLVLLLAGVVLLTWDVHADDPRSGEPASMPAACGSAYDVVLLRGYGDMGGEPVDNQPELDAQCVRNSGRLVVRGVAAGSAGVVLLLAVLAVQAATAWDARRPQL
jgi:hypothetical protein